MFTQILKKEINPSYAVAAVIPGEVDTDMQGILRNTEHFAMQEIFKTNQAQGLLMNPEVSAQFLSWLLCDIPFATFNEKDEPWNIYDASYHTKWLRGVLPDFK